MASAGIKIYSVANSQHFYPTGATSCTDLCEVWHRRGARRSPWKCKISLQSVPKGGNVAPKFDNFHFLVKKYRPTWANALTLWGDFYQKVAPQGPQGRTLWPISTTVGGFLAHLSYISVSHLTWFVSQVTELLLRSRASVIYPEFFRAPWRKNCESLLMVSTSSITKHRFENRTMRAGCRCENTVFVFSGI